MPQLAFRRRPQTAPRERRGVVLVMSALLIVVVFAMAAMAIDVGYMMLTKTQLQAAADAGALAAGNALHKPRREVKSIAKDFVTLHKAAGRQIKRGEAKVEIGVYDMETRSFRAEAGVGNAVRVTARRDGESLFFARVIGTDNFSTEATAISMANPKDIALVIDLSGSMNDDTEPAWATSTVNAEFGPQGYPTVGTDLMQDLYDDFGYGSFPGRLEYLGRPVGVPQGSVAYAELTTDDGPLSRRSVRFRDRIVAGDSEQTRREKSYRWIIENQLARLLPEARPRPTVANYPYWEKYIDYVLRSHQISAPKPPKDDDDDDDDDDDRGSSSGSSGGGAKSGGGSSSGGSSGGSGGGSSKPKSQPKPKPAPKPPIGWTPTRPRSDRLAKSHFEGISLIAGQRFGLASLGLTGVAYGTAASGPGLPRVGGLYGKYNAWVPPQQDGDRIDQFNNPNKQSFPSAKDSLPRGLRNYFGYLTYVQFMMDHGRNLQPDGNQHVTLSMDSGYCPLRTESVAGRRFEFPPRTQPMHAMRRATIAAIDVAVDRNRRVPSATHRDRIGVVTFDTPEGSTVRHPLTSDYVQAMTAISKLQAVGDKATTTATATGLRVAQEMLRPESKGGQARDKSTKIVILMTDGMPNAYEVADGELEEFARKDDSGEAYGEGYFWLDAALLRTYALRTAKVDVFPVGVGLGTDYDFMDRAARIGGTGGDDGQARRGTGNPAEYEALLTKMFEEIISLPTARLVE